MTLPPRAFFSLNEFSDRLDCSYADVAGWSIVGHFSIVTGIAPVLCGLQPVAGMVAVNAADMMKIPSSRAMRRGMPGDPHSAGGQY